MKAITLADQVLLELQARAAGESDVVQLERSPSSSTLSYVICREKLDIVDPEQTEKKKLTEVQRLPPLHMSKKSLLTKPPLILTTDAE